MDLITDGIYQISVGSNSFIVDGDDGLLLVDSGLPGREDQIEEALSSIGRRTDDIRALLVTHAHVDHIGGGAALAAGHDVEVVVSAGDAPVVRGERPTSPPPRLDFPGLRLVIRLLPTHDPMPVTLELTGPGPIPGFEEVMAIPTPGHTAGHVAYLLDRAGGVLFAGDAAVGSRRRVKRGFMNRRTATIDASIRTLAARDFEIACFGHSGPIVGGASGAFRRFVEGLA